MNSVMRNLRSYAGGILLTTITLIVVFFVWNYLSSKNLGPVSSAASWIATHANGSAYSGATAPAPSAAAPAAVSYQGLMH